MNSFIYSLVSSWLLLKYCCCCCCGCSGIICQMEWKYCVCVHVCVCVCVCGCACVCVCMCFSCRTRLTLSHGGDLHSTHRLTLPFFTAVSTTSPRPKAAFHSAWPAHTFKVALACHFTQSQTSPLLLPSSPTPPCSPLYSILPFLKSSASFL